MTPITFTLTVEGKTTSAIRSKRDLAKILENLAQRLRQIPGEGFDTGKVRDQLGTVVGEWEYRGSK